MAEAARPGAGQTALITGASSGIGLELARLFASDGYRLVLVARRRDRLEALAAELHAQGAEPGAIVVRDLADPASVDALVDALAQGGIDVDVLVNNAGYATSGRFDQIAARVDLDMLQVNVMTLTALTKRLLPGMISRGRGRILNVASTAAFQPGPGMAAYYASKAYVLSLSEALSEELRGTGVTVTALCPGSTRSGFQERAGIQGIPLLRLGLLSAERVAADGYRGLMRGQALVIPHWRHRLMVVLARFSPRALIRRVIAKLQMRPQ